MRFGASLDVRFEESIEEFAEFVTDRGLSHVELRQAYLDVHPDAPDAERLRRVAEEYDLTYSVHAPHVDCAPGNVTERLRRAAVDSVEDSIDLATAIDAGAVVVHGGSARKRYPQRVHDRVYEQAVQSISECAAYASERDVPLCLENQPESSSKRRHTATPDRLERFLADVGADPETLRLTLDVGHAQVSGTEYGAFVERFGDRIHHLHLHDNDGTGDDHEPLPGFREIAAEVGAPHNVLEMKSLADIDRCLETTAPTRSDGGT